MPWPVHPTGFFGARGDQDTYKIERSLRFNSADSAYLSRTPASAGNRKTWTWSGWVKRTALSPGTVGVFEAASNASNRSVLFFTSTDTLGFFENSSGSTVTNIATNQVFRDFSSWSHIIISVDTTQSVSSERVKLYHNGTQITSFASSTYPSQNFDTQVNSTVANVIGAGTAYTPAAFINGYLTEINFIDGQALTPSSFGETDAITGRWKAKAYSGTYGTNGFYLKFADNSGTTSTTLGKDSSPNGNNWTPNNFSVTAGAGNDSLVDSPTNYGSDTGVGGEVRGNYCTLNPLAKMSSITLSNGNLEASSSSASLCVALGTHGANTGKWYFEMTLANNVAAPDIGWHQSEYTDAQLNPSGSVRSGGYVICTDGDARFVQTLNNGTSTQITSAGGISTAWLTNDVIGCAIDMDNKIIWFSRNGTWYPASIGGAAGNPSAGTNPAITYTHTGYLLPRTSCYSTNYTPIINFGQRPFAYTAPSGFKALCTTNLPQPTIQKPSSAMDVVTYTGNGSARSITGLGFSPDLVWIKGRSGATDHAIYDSVRGVQKDLGSNLTTDETTQTQGLTAFNSDGFDIGTLAKINTNTSTYVAWAWDRAAIDGLDIVSYTGNGANRTIAHNLGVAPKMIIVKARTTAGADQGWPVYHASLANTQYLLLNSTAAAANGADYWNSTSPTSSVFSLGTNAAVNLNNDTYIAYLFAEVEGFSKFGSYTGNGSADGPFVWCGFRPAFVMIKGSSFISNWFIQDYQRSNFNLIEAALRPNLANSEVTGVSTYSLDTLSNGFKLRTSAGDSNTSSATFIFAAFAESPFKYARAR